MRREQWITSLSGASFFNNSAKPDIFPNTTGVPSVHSVPEYQSIIIFDLTCIYIDVKVCQTNLYFQIVLPTPTMSFKYPPKEVRVLWVKNHCPNVTRWALYRPPTPVHSLDPFLDNKGQTAVVLTARQISLVTITNHLPANNIKQYRL